MANRRLPDAPASPPEAAPAAESSPLKRPLRAPKPTPAAAPRTRVTAEARRALIAENAYLRAERRGFAPGHEVDDWLAAEAEVDALLRAEYGGSPQ
jgi:Protein of unknown function (DUF2934)